MNIREDILEALAETDGPVWISILATLCDRSVEELAPVLIAMNRAGEVQLRRCDLANLMPRHLVEQSCIEYMHATFHYVQLRTK